MNNNRVLYNLEKELEFEDEGHAINFNSERIFRERTDFFANLDEATFVQRFRLNKATCKIILAKINSQISTLTNRNYALKPETKLLLALRFYGSGSFLTTAGDFCGVSVPSASRAVKEVSQAIAKLSKEFINFELISTEDNTMDFYSIANFPKVIGAIGCTHVRIQSPGGANAELFRNRKGYFSLNVQAVCNAKLMLTNLVARWPGSAQDSTILNNSRLKVRLDKGEFRNYYILGDGGYETNKYMMTPLLNPKTEAERLYNQSQIRTRNTIERCFGAMKQRFPVLAVGMRISLNTAMAVIVACGVLHNISILENNPMPNEEEDIKDIQIDTKNLDELETETRNEEIGSYREILISDCFAVNT